MRADERRQRKEVHDRQLHAIAAWQRAEEAAHAAEGIAARERALGRVAHRRASEERRRAADACATRQVAFAHGLADAAAAHERAAEAAERRAEEADRLARPLRLEADARLHALARLLRDAFGTANERGDSTRK